MSIARIGESAMIENLLQGKWVKHPLHPAIVHIPVSMWITSLVFDFLALSGSETELLSRLSVYALALGLVVALLAIPTGIADWWSIGKENPAWKLGVFHMAMNWIASLAFGVSLGVRLVNGSSNVVSALPLILSIVGVGFLLVGIYLGGRMTYEYGVSVARNSKDRWRKLAQEGQAKVPSE
jgi:uncharacterized membrane protein